MAKVMEPDSANSGLIQRLMELFDDTAGLDRGTHAIREDVAGLLPIRARPKLLGDTTDFSAAWRLNGEPLADAKVTFDGDHSYFVVQGTCSFTEVGYYPTTAAGAYTAYVFWDGSKPVPVKIFGPLMAN